VEAERSYEKASALKADDLLLAYNLAALYAKWGRKADAIEQLKVALKADRAKVSAWLKADPMFDALEGEADFEALR
jgi:predicted Zn-dependent protease